MLVTCIMDLQCVVISVMVDLDAESHSSYTSDLASDLDAESHAIEIILMNLNSAINTVAVAGTWAAVLALSPRLWCPLTDLGVSKSVARIMQ